MADELLPCPFCGGEPEIERLGTPRQSTIYACTECGCLLETGEEFNHGKQWNTRTSQASPPPQTEDQWQTHTGGGCPVHGDSTVEVKTRGGSLATMRASAVVWDYGSTIWEIPGPLPPECQIIEYRVVAPPQEEVLLNDIGMMMSEFVDNWPEPKKIKTALALIAKTMRAALNPPKHIFWGAGEPDCPREIKAGNGELHTLRCKVCGEDDPRSERCRAALTAMTPPPLSDEVIHRAARAINDDRSRRHYGIPGDWEGLTEYHQNECLYAARAALTAMKGTGDE